MAIRLDGKTVADSVYARLTKEIAELRGTPKIVFVRVGEDPASQTYVKMKEKRAHALGAMSDTIIFPEDVSETELVDKIRWLNQEPSCRGILVQLPLPPHINKHRVLERIDPAKDVDGLHSRNLGLLFQGRPRFVPCTPAGIIEMLSFYEIPIQGKRVTVVGRSEIVGKPASQLFLMKHGTVTVCHSKTEDLASVTREADILVVAAGRPQMIGADHVKEGAVVIDVGIHRVEKKLVGDVKFDEVESKVSAISPVPGGVGPMTIAMLMNNLVQAHREH